MVSEKTKEKDKQRRTVETFRIYPYRNSDNLHLRLTGVFDEDAALSLMEALNENSAGVGKIFVHTAALEQVMGSGVDMFRRNVGALDRLGAEIIFTGNAGENIAGNEPAVRFVK